MRWLIPLFALSTLPAAAAPPSMPGMLEQLVVPQDQGEQVVLFQARSFAPGAESGWHVHPGVEMAYVVSGEMELQTAGGVRVLGPGDSFQMPRGTPHNGANHGSVSADIVLTLVVDKDAPARQPVPAPQ